MVNVKDFENAVPSGDMLETIFRRQEELIEKYEPIEERNLGHPVPRGVYNLDDPACQQRIKDFCWRITEELGEAANCLKNKPWKLTHQATDKEHFLEELMDAFHFTMELLIHCGFTPEALVKMYLNKSDVNKFRIRSQY